MSLAILAAASVSAEQPFPISEFVERFSPYYYSSTFFIVGSCFFVLSVFVFCLRKLWLSLIIFLLSLVLMAVTLLPPGQAKSMPELSQSFITWAHERYGVDFSNQNESILSKTLRKMDKEPNGKTSETMLDNSNNKYALENTEDGIILKKYDPFEQNGKNGIDMSRELPVISGTSGSSLSSKAGG